MKIALLSTPKSEILGHIINSFVSKKISIEAIIFDSKLPNQKHHILWQERTKGKIPLIPLHNYENKMIPCYYFTSHCSDSFEKFILEKNIDVLVNAGTPRILKKNILNSPTIGVINCHPGIMPNFRGCTCVEWAIYHDEPVGNTVHLMSDKIDEGPILLKEEISFLKSDSYSDIRVKVYKHGFELLSRSLEDFIRNPNINLEYDQGGRYFKVIDKDKMNEVLKKISSGSYAYQF